MAGTPTDYLVLVNVEAGRNFSQYTTKGPGTTVVTNFTRVRIDPGCSGANVANGVGNIDLVGTPFKVIDPFCTAGYMAAGKAVLSDNDQVVDLTGGGGCGWTGPTKDDKCVDNPHNKTNGFVLELAYIDDSSP